MELHLSRMDCRCCCCLGGTLEGAGVQRWRGLSDLHQQPSEGTRMCHFLISFLVR